jgi:4-methyl-5(b-hydroxyethyl)-thiazole monophosphate biosynthesis
MKGLLRGYRATCYPGYEEQLLGATVTGASVESDRNRITAKGAGVSIPFALAIVEKLVSKETADTLGDAMQCRLVTSDN